jgi:hypothetical protein
MLEKVPEHRKARKNWVDYSSTIVHRGWSSFPPEPAGSWTFPELG